MWVVSCQLLSKLQPTTDNPQPITHNRQPTTDNRQPTTDNRQPKPMQKETLYEQIEQYIKGEMKADTKTAFEAQLAKDAELKAEVNFQRDLYQELEHRQKQLLRNKLHDLGEEFMANIPEGNPDSASKRWRNSVAGLMLLVLGAGAVWFLNRDDRLAVDSEVVPAPGEANQEVPMEAEKDITTEIEEEILGGSAESDSDEPPAPIHPEPSNTEGQEPEKKDKAPRPIAGNFEPNPSFERYFTGTLARGADFEVTVDAPQQISTGTLVNGQFQFNCSGQVTSESGDAPIDFRLRFFTNNPEDFQADRALQEWELEFNNTNNTHLFELSETLTFEPGLYYFTIEDWESGEKFFVGKISLIMNEK